MYESHQMRPILIMKDYSVAIEGKYFNVVELLQDYSEQKVLFYDHMRKINRYNSCTN